MSYRFNPFTGNLDIVGAGGSGGSENFSYYAIQSGETIVVPDGQEMVVTQDIMVRGDFIVRGIVTQLQSEDNGFAWTTIPSNTVVKVPENRILFYRSPLLMVEGELRVIGDLLEV